MAERKERSAKKKRYENKGHVQGTRKQERKGRRGRNHRRKERGREGGRERRRRRREQRTQIKRIEYTKRRTSAMREQEKKESRYGNGAREINGDGAMARI